MHLKKLTLLITCLLFVTAIRGDKKKNQDFEVTWNGDDPQGPWNDVGYQCPDISITEYFGNVPFSKIVSVVTTENADGSSYDIESIKEAKTRIYPAEFCLYDILVHVSAQDIIETNFDWQFKVDLKTNEIIFMRGKTAVFKPYYTFPIVDINNDNLDELIPLEGKCLFNITKPSIFPIDEFRLRKCICLPKKNSIF